MRSTFKAREVIRENLNNFYESRIISDIRIVYDDSGNLDDKDQVAVIVHNLRIKYSSKPVPRGEIFISLNLEDLHQLKDVVDRAIEKDKLIRTNSHSLTFIEPQ